MATKVTLIGHYPPPYGGVATLMAQMESALGAAGLPVTIWNLGHGNPSGERVVDFDDAMNDPTCVGSCPRRSRSTTQP